jgi:hypothetical protein
MTAITWWPPNGGGHRRCYCRPAAGRSPWPTVVGMVLHGPRAGDVVRLAAEAYAAEAIAEDLAELGAMPPVVVVEPWQVVAVVEYADQRAEVTP